MDYYVSIMRNYANFDGRARREEYWMFQLFNTLILVALFILGLLFEPLFFIAFIYVLLVIVPSLSVTVRRLHDIDLSGWWVLIKFVPYLGELALFVMTCIDSTYGSNRFGENPKGRGMEEKAFIEF